MNTRAGMGTKHKTEDRDGEIGVPEKAVGMFQKTTGLAADVRPVPFSDASDSPDVRVRITFQGTARHYHAAVTARSTPAGIGLAVRKLGGLSQKSLVIAGHIPSGLADRLRKTGIMFLDTAGNAYINDPPLFIFVKGNKPEAPLCSGTLTRAFRPAGLKVIFAMLCNPGLENAPFREIAGVAMVALGSVSVVMNDLMRAGHLSDMGTRGRRLIRKEELMGRWVTSYPEQLRPKQIIGFYRAADNTPRDHIVLAPFEARWGGEAAADILTGYLRPRTATVYIKKPVREFLLKNMLRKDPHGNIEILRAFWTFEDRRTSPVVHPLLIYADLLASDDPRNIETAGIVYEQEVAQFVRED